MLLGRRCLLAFAAACSWPGGCSPCGGSCTCAPSWCWALGTQRRLAFSIASWTCILRIRGRLQLQARKHGGARNDDDVGDGALDKSYEHHRTYCTSWYYPRKHWYISHLLVMRLVWRLASRTGNAVQSSEAHSSSASPVVPDQPCAAAADTCTNHCKLTCVVRMQRRRDRCERDDTR